MGFESKIEWCDHTFNPVRGCQKVSPGCANCYAETQSKLNPKVLGEWGADGTRVVATESYWQQPLKWNRKAKQQGVKRRVFCASLSDVFEDRPEWVAPRVRLFHLINETPHLIWLLLTKRPENVLRFCGGEGVPRSWAANMPENVWLGVSIEDQQRANERIPILLSLPVRLRFLSVEPLLGPIDLWRWLEDEEWGWCNCCLQTTRLVKGIDCRNCGDCRTRAGRTGLHWIIVGGESGSGARVSEVDWIRNLVGQCKEAHVSCFVKQLGAHVVDPRTTVAHSVPERECWPLPVSTDVHRVFLKNPKGGDPEEWPEDLRVRQFPTGS